MDRLNMRKREVQHEEWLRCLYAPWIESDSPEPDHEERFRVLLDALAHLPTEQRVGRGA